MEQTLGALAANLSRNGSQAVVTLTGEIAAATCSDLHALAVAGIGSSTITDLVIDMTRVTYVDSSGLDCLVAVGKAAAKVNVALVIRGVQPKAMTLFQISGLDGALEIVPVTPESV